MSDDRAANRVVRTITDAKALAAMANPTRSRLLDVLAVDGPSTASSLAQRTGQAVGSISHHLKVLSAAELVEEAPGLSRDRRERWWRLTSINTRWSRSEFADDTGAVTAALAAETLGLQTQFERARDWLATSADAGDWDDAAFATQTWMQLTPDELRAFSGELVELMRRWRDRTRSSPEIDDTEAERRSVIVFARGFPAQP